MFGKSTACLYAPQHAQFYYPDEKRQAQKLTMRVSVIIKKTAAIALLLLACLPAPAQDLLARQAPVDRKMRALDTIMLRDVYMEDEIDDLSSDLYDDWNNKFAHKATDLPETYRIDLRDFCMPTTSRVITSDFGPRWRREHKGLDIKVYTGDTIRAAFSGRVRMVKYERAGYGKYIVIRHNNGLETIYAHLSKQLVKEDQDVRAGDVIGLGGNTGRSTGSHLHFETRLCGVALNPALMFDFRAQDVVGDYYDFNRNTYQAESREATRLRGKIGDGSYTREEVQGTAVPTAGKKAATTKKTHKVRKGDTLSKISKKYGVSLDKLYRLNGLNKNSKLRVGQLIRYS